jgi:hypothetical protein
MPTRFLFWKALMGLLLYRLLVRENKFAQLHDRVRQWRVKSPQADVETLTRVQEAVDLACLWYPKPVLCLHRSVVLTYLLRRAGVPAMLIIGAQRVPFRSHAWVEVEGRVVNDKPDMRNRYLVLECI